ncbi:unnamed protein product [Mytilus edulis]|uniref:Uncharacterized protein n=1 Tax=Mytilus edulis TaxID=6550 RepID=A0A8S3SQG6_MYTED|nr:unnamed protein product [Mytilus edulis]
MMEKQIHELREVVLANQLLKQQLGELGLLQKQIQKDHEAETVELKISLEQEKAQYTKEFHQQTEMVRTEHCRQIEMVHTEQADIECRFKIKQDKDSEILLHVCSIYILVFSRVGESGHRQNECTSEMPSEQEQEGATSAHHENHYDPSDVNTQPTNNNENLDAMQPTEHEAHAENDSASDTNNHDDFIRSQSIFSDDQISSPICDQQNQPPSARPKIKPGRRETNKPSHTSSEATSRNSRGQSQITSFINGQNFKQKWFREVSSDAHRETT